VLDQIAERRAHSPGADHPGLLLDIGFHQLQKVVSLKPAETPDEPERPEQIAAVLKLFEVKGHHDPQEFLGRVIEIAA